MTKPVEFYTKQNCVQCIQTARLLDREGIPYTSISLDDDPDAIGIVKELGYLQAPVVVTEDDHWSGFRPDKIKAL